MVGYVIKTFPGGENIFFGAIYQNFGTLICKCFYHGNSLTRCYLCTIVYCIVGGIYVSFEVRNRLEFMRGGSGGGGGVNCYQMDLISPSSPTVARPKKLAAFGIHA